MTSVVRYLVFANIGVFLLATCQDLIDFVGPRLLEALTGNNNILNGIATAKQKSGEASSKEQVAYIKQQIGK